MLLIAFSKKNLNPVLQFNEKKKENKNSQILDLTVNNQKRALFPRVHVLNLSAY